ncbi:rhamnogalacturonan acetylesterase [Maribellus comscasis]|uniref:Rhamnogalacturonan acetylesterase n=1 Tax=Maribellus comscasis TaxID=2681766 RepID=A0A6I6JSA4_9BACT|nr:rhamnogalacturonan acetylesterase [Maribellus comscasis]QGY43970.1 rhamnogalacturonan acetylesterase [Maribellus comscasis]
MKRLATAGILFILLVNACKTEKADISVYSIGDSTMASKKAEVYPETGWCQVIGQFFDETVTVHNHAVNGRSSKSFINEGRWQVVLDSLQKGDVVFIQFGHNDQKDYDTTRYTTPFGTYSENLTEFVKESREKGATPVLFTSIIRRKFGENGKLTDTHGDYPVATRKVANDLDVPLIDLQKITERWVNNLGDEASKKMFLWTKPNERFMEGRKDDTHLSVEGATKVAQLAIQELKKANLKISERVYFEEDITKARE